MVFPLHDDNPTELFPFFTLGIIAACGAGWLFLQGGGFSPRDLTASICALGAIPAEITGRVDVRLLGRAPCRLGGLTWEAVFTSMFLHGGWFHLLGNMWFLWIFGNNVEDSMGHLRFLVFYLTCGVVAALAHVALDPGGVTPMVGASGAISGVMGAYLVLYPRARVDTLFFFFIFVRVVPLPAWLMLGYWMLIQLFGIGMGPSAGGGVAYAAHVGGFLAGLALVGVFANPKLVGAKRAGVVLARHDLDNRGWW